MFEQCQNCLFYEKDDDDMRRSLKDKIIENDPNPDKHYCDCWAKQGYVIPKNIWEDKTTCPHYAKDKWRK